MALFELIINKLKIAEKPNLNLPLRRKDEGIPLTPINLLVSVHILSIKKSRKFHC